MNKADLNIIRALIGDLNLARTRLEELQEDHQGRIDNMPENLQNGERYEKMEEDQSNLDDLMTALEELISDAERLTE